ncbi:MAG: type VI secretion system contractile sheath large subunit, partial [Wenzhouxiangella sp.]|nr:type VI secretion system contractile sheath large subunit [Wenzhouxiangella sp.]
MATEKETAQQQGATEVAEASDFSSLLQKEFRPKSERAKSEVESAVKILAEHVLEGVALVSDDAVTTINALVAEIDRRLTDQINKIMHHEDFQQLEGSWRGLHHHVMNTETDEMLKIRVMNVGKNELAKMFKRYPGASWDQSPLFKKIYEEEYGQLGGEPFGCLVGDYVFDHSAKDVAILNGMAQIAAAAHAPFLAAAG